MDDGGAVEVKLGAGDIDEAAEGLVKLRNKVDVSRMGHPSFLMVLTGTDLGYRRDDGVIVRPPLSRSGGIKGQLIDTVKLIQ